MEFEPRNRAAYVPAADALVCADLHVGRDETSDVAFRVGEHEDLRTRFAALCTRYEPSEVVVAGDLLHSFSGLPTGVVETVRALEAAAESVGARFVVTPGNHDAMVAEICDGPTPEEYRLDTTDAAADGADDGTPDSIVVTHGHADPEPEADWYVVGHDHPTLDVEGQRRPCYLHGRAGWSAGDVGSSAEGVDRSAEAVDRSGEGTGRSGGGAGVLMLPAFSRLPAGVPVNDMTAADFQSPLVASTDALRPVVRDEAADRSHEFPPLGECRHLL